MRGRERFVRRIDEIDECGPRLQAAARPVAATGGRAVVEGIERAARQPGWRLSGVERTADRPARPWMGLPALLLPGLIALLQRRRPDDAPARPATAAA